MNCRSAESLFSSYIEDEISQVERRNFEAHLLGCRRCSVAMRDVRETMSVLERMPVVEPSAHFDEDVIAKIRSGEGLRPSFAELVRELFSPARLRPLYVVGAGACAVATAFLISPVGQGWMHTAPVPTSSIARTQEPAPSAVVAPPVVPATEIVAERSVPSSERGVASSPRVGSMVANVSRSTTAADRDSIVEGGLPRQRYKDEIINDQFYLESGRQVQDPSVVPVNETQDDGVFIVF
jgi:anti-sigma factor RsiW